MCFLLFLQFTCLYIPPFCISDFSCGQNKIFLHVLYHCFAPVLMLTSFFLFLYIILSFTIYLSFTFYFYLGFSMYTLTKTTFGYIIGYILTTRKPVRYLLTMWDLVQIGLLGGTKKPKCMFWHQWGSSVSPCIGRLMAVCSRIYQIRGCMFTDRATSLMYWSPCS